MAWKKSARRSATSTSSAGASGSPSPTIVTRTQSTEKIDAYSRTNEPPAR